MRQGERRGTSASRADQRRPDLYSSWILFASLPEKMMNKAGEVGEAGREAWHLCQQSGQLASPTFRGHEIALSIVRITQRIY